MPDLPIMAVVSGITSLAKYAASGVGAIANTILADWRASKEGKARLMSAHYDAEIRRVEAEAEAQALEIMAGSQTRIMRATDADIDVTAARLGISHSDIDQLMQFQTVKRVANTSSVIEGAAEDLVDKEVPDHDPDPDWTARFFDCVKDVSSEDMQKLWSRILSGEVESPGRTSLPTLDILRNLTTSDAELFESLCGLMMRNDFIFYDDSVDDSLGLNYGTLLHLQDCGLVRLASFLEITLGYTGEGNIFLWGQNATLMISSDEDSPEPLSVPIVSVTAAGQELASIIDCSLNDDYLRAFASFLRDKNSKLYYLENPVRDSAAKRITFSNRILIDPS